MGDRLILASASPRRLELLRLAGLDPVVEPADIDELVHDDEAPDAYVRRLAEQKAAAVSARHTGVVLAADTTVVLGAEILGKPQDAADALRMLRRLSGTTHTVTTAVAVFCDGRRHADTVTTRVTMTTLDDATLSRYVATGEPLDKAGGYGIQGRAAAFVERIDGSYTNVVGLPLVESLRLLRSAGLAFDS